VIRARGSSASAWARRGALAAVLIGALVIPEHASESAASPCTGPHCHGAAGAILWSRRLPGTWIAETGGDGTVPSHGDAYAAVGGRVAVLGVRLDVAAYDAGNGRLLWSAALTGFPAGSSIVSVRAWPGVVTAGVWLPAAAGGGSITREEVVLRAGSGRRIGTYHAALYGGAVAADAAHTVIVGNTAVTSYDNGSGRVLWSRPTGRVPQAWQVDGDQLYVSVAADGYLGSAPVTALRRISLATGAERMVSPQAHSFAGTLSGAFDGVVLFTGAGGVTGYSGTTGQLLWHRAGMLPETEDLVLGTLYLAAADRLVGVNPLTGDAIRGASAPGASGLYGVRAGVALGLDTGALGDAWGYDVARRRVVWTTSALPWPHYFVDLSGIGGSAAPASGTVLLAYCALLGTAAAGGQPQSGQVCLRPELVAINR
jgi:PQQ-like domain